MQCKNSKSRISQTCKVKQQEDPARFAQCKKKNWPTWDSQCKNSRDKILQCVSKIQFKTAFRYLGNWIINDWKEIRTLPTYKNSICFIEEIIMNTSFWKGGSFIFWNQSWLSVYIYSISKPTYSAKTKDWLKATEFDATCNLWVIWFFVNWNLRN